MNLATVSQALTTEYANGFDYTDLARMARFAQYPPECLTEPARLHPAIEHAREEAARRLPGSEQEP